MLNPLEWKHRVAGQPFRLARRLIGPLSEVDDTESANFGALVTYGLGAAYTITMNMAAPLGLIQAGVRGNTYFSGLTIGYHASGFPKPMFNYITPASKAELLGGRVGKRIAGKAGVKIGARVAGRLIPGVGWALLAYDVYDIAYNRSLWGFDF